MKKFNVGDTVIVVNKTSDKASYEIGEVGKVTGYAIEDICRVNIDGEMKNIFEFNLDKILSVGDYGTLKEAYNDGKKGDKVKIIDYWYDNNKLIGYHYENKTRNNYGICYLKRIESLKPLIEVGTTLKLKTPILGADDLKVGTVARVVKSDERRAILEIDCGLFGTKISINEQALKEEWEVFDEWSKWTSYNGSKGNCVYRRKGNTIQVANNIGYKGYAKCSENDVFDLDKGIEIALKRAKIKELKSVIEIQKSMIENLEKEIKSF